MPRPPRIDFANAIYHVTSRENGRARIFFNDQDRSRFLRQLRDNAETAAIALYAYVLMDNHFHKTNRQEALDSRGSFRDDTLVRGPPAQRTPTLAASKPAMVHEGSPG